MESSSSWIRRMETSLIAFGILVFKSVFFFLAPHHQSLMVSFFHYAIFFLGIYYFIYRAKPNGTYRPLFFAVILFSLLCYLVFNKCILTHIELGLFKETNLIQGTVEAFFGSQTEGNTSSRVVLSFLTLLTGVYLLNDYGILKVSD